jgi:hypothetical protein
MTDNIPDPTDVTTDNLGQPTKTPQPKVLAATAGAGVGAALTTLGVWIFETATKIDLPTTVEGAVLVLVTSGVAFGAGYIKKPSGIS